MKLGEALLRGAHAGPAPAGPHTRVFFQLNLSHLVPESTEVVPGAGPQNTPKMLNLSHGGIQSEGTFQLNLNIT